MRPRQIEPRHFNPEATLEAAPSQELLREMMRAHASLSIPIEIEPPDSGQPSEPSLDLRFAVAELPRLRPSPSTLPLAGHANTTVSMTAPPPPVESVGAQARVALLAFAATLGVIFALFEALRALGVVR